MRGQFFTVTRQASQLSDMTKWVTYTPTFTGFGTVTGISVRSRRLVDSLSIMGRFTCGVPTGTEARMSLGFNGVENTINSLATLPALSYAGDASTDAIGASKPSILIEPSVAYITFGMAGTTTIGLSKLLANAILTTGTTFSFIASIPIEEWK